MSWVKLDDQWMDHPKIIKAGRDARDMWLAAITWCSKHLTDGHFPSNLLPTLAVTAGVDVANCQTFANTLLEVRLIDATPDGYMVHDYLDYNPSKEQALATREARKEAGKAGGLAKALAKSKQNSGKTLPPPPPPPPDVPKKGNKGKGNSDRATPEPSFPASLNVPAFHEAWADWVAFRKQKKQTLTNISIQRQFALLEKYPVSIAVAMLNQSITSGYTGIFPLKTNGNGNGNNHQGLTQYENPVTGEVIWR